MHWTAFREKIQLEHFYVRPSIYACKWNNPGRCHLLIRNRDHRTEAFFASEPDRLSPSFFKDGNFSVGINKSPKIDMGKRPDTWEQLTVVLKDPLAIDYLVLVKHIRMRIKPVSKLFGYIYLQQIVEHGRIFLRSLSFSIWKWHSTQFIVLFYSSFVL